MFILRNNYLRRTKGEVKKMGEIADDIINGFCCSHCGIYFEEEHGYPVLCKDCYESETEEERAGIQKAYIKEL